MHVATFSTHDVDELYLGKKKQGVSEQKNTNYRMAFPSSTTAWDILATNTIAVNKILSDWENDNNCC
jgi:hypothetical protein